MHVTVHAKMTMHDSQRIPLKLCLFKYELDINVYNFENCLLKLWCIYKSDLRFSIEEKRVGIIRIEHV